MQRTPSIQTEFTGFENALRHAGNPLDMQWDAVTSSGRRINQQRINSKFSRNQLRQQYPGMSLERAGYQQGYNLTTQTRSQNARNIARKIAEEQRQRGIHKHGGGNKQQLAYKVARQGVFGAAAGLRSRNMSYPGHLERAINATPYTYTYNHMTPKNKLESEIWRYNQGYSPHWRQMQGYKKGGKIPKAGFYKLHKGEVVIPASRVKSIDKAIKNAGLKPLRKHCKECLHPNKK